MSTFAMEPEPQHGVPGAARQADGTVVWRVWAPFSPTVSLVTWEHGQRAETAMTPEGYGYFTHVQSGVPEGMPYLFRLADGQEYPDPASRWQPQGVPGRSAVFFPDAYPWNDAGWRGVAREDLVIYELHVGTFTPEGTLAAIAPRLPELAALGVTAVELMPVGQFPGDRNWGYDGVYLYAVQNSYGGPRALQQLVDAAHHSGLAVILDVVYNHLGPEGNYLGKFGPYFTDRYRTPWGSAMNFDGPQSDPVRQFVIENACAWVRDFHVDGLRLDAVQAIFDCGARHILADIQAAVGQQSARHNRRMHVIAESNQNDVRLVHPPARGGYGLDGVWCDDFHHSVHALLTGERDGYYQDFGRPEQLAKALNRMFVYDGCYSPFRQRRHGSRAGGLDRAHFVVSIQNHDQVGNHAGSTRFGSFLPPEAQRLASALMLLSPCVPLLFMGEEYGETRPFPFFCEFADPALIVAVRRGRREELARLASTLGTEVPDPQDPATFASAKIGWSWPEHSFAGQLRRLYQDLLAARREWPALGDRRHTSARVIRVGNADGDSPRVKADRSRGNAILVLARGRDDRVTALANLTPNTVSLPHLRTTGRQPVLSTEDARYGGIRPAGQALERLYPYELIILRGR